jgi:hypothetical protein
VPAQTTPLAAGHPAQIAGGGDAGFTLTNTGTQLVYLDDSGQVGPASYPLKTGATIVWDAGRPCWALAVADGGQLSRLDNTGPIYDPQAIATALTEAGLASAIATDLDAVLPAHTAAEVLTTGVKIIDVPDTYAGSLNHNFAFPVGGGGPPPWQLGPYDTSAIQSLIVELDTGTIHGTIAPAVGRWLQVDIAWSNGETAGFSGLRQTVFLHHDDGGSVMALRVPALGTTATITITDNRTFGTAMSAKATVIGSQRPTDRITVNQRVANAATAVPWLYNEPSTRRIATDPATPASLTTGAVVAALPPRAGVLDVTVNPTAATTATAGRLALLDHNGVRIGPQVLIPASTAPAAATTLLTARVGWHPVYLWCDTAPSGAGQAHVGASWTDD